MVGQKLKALRISKKLSQDDVSKATGITRYEIAFDDVGTKKLMATYAKLRKA